MDDVRWFTIKFLKSNPNLHIGYLFLRQGKELFSLGLLREDVVGPNVVRWLEQTLNARNSPGRIINGMVCHFRVMKSADRASVLILDQRSNNTMEYICFARSELLDDGFSPVCRVERHRDLVRWIIDSLTLATPFRGDLTTEPQNAKIGRSPLEDFGPLDRSVQSLRPAKGTRSPPTTIVAENHEVRSVRTDDLQVL